MMTSGPKLQCDLVFTLQIKEYQAEQFIANIETFFLYGEETASLVETAPWGAGSVLVKLMPHSIC